MHRAIFMDRDGTVSEEVGYMYHAGLYRPFPWTGQAVRRINESGMKAILVTNQSGLTRGYFSEATLNEVHGVLKQELARWDAHLDAIYYCPHLPDGGCDCRKPKAGMMIQASQELDIDLGRSYVIGDRYLDVRMAHTAGARSILVRTGDGTMELENRKHDSEQPNFVAENLLSAVEAILNGEADGDLRELIHNFKDRRVVVFGDLVADVFVYGEISRISREAPVLVLNHKETQLVPGGGANAIHNLRTLGAQPIPVGIVGDDEEGRQLLDFFSRLDVDISGIQIARSYRTPTKMRILAGAVHSHRQQIVRLDSGGPLTDIHSRSEVERRLRHALKGADALLVSDYGYGLVDPELVAKVRKPSIPTAIDSRFDLHRYNGLTAATPNEPEVEAILGISIGNDLKKLEWAGRTLLRKQKHDALLITRGKDGMALFERGRKTIYIPISGSDEIADVTGAGDTVIATFTLALAAGGSFADAAHLSNHAGGIVVMKYGTRPVFMDELLKVLDGEPA